ncbi:MAG: hypothetical protein J6A89_06610 [Clostridia bacterium]|nr:hypothetical protein [Clostridia bacterium]
MVCLSGCNNKQENQDIDKKIAIEIDFLDDQIASFIDIITGNIETKYDIVEEETKVKSSESNSGENSSNQKSSEGSSSSGESGSGGSSDSTDVTTMSMQYKEQSESNKRNWDEIKESIESLYISWATIQSDINIKEGISDEKLIEINGSFDNLLIYATEQNEVNFIKESVKIYNNIIDIAEKINYDKNKLYVLKVKKTIYEAYSNVLEENWDLAKNNVELANNYLQNIDNIESKITMIFKNLLDSTNKKDRKIFFIKYSDVVNELNYLSI